MSFRQIFGTVIVSKYETYHQHRRPAPCPAYPCGPATPRGGAIGQSTSPPGRAGAPACHQATVSCRAGPAPAPGLQLPPASRCGELAQSLHRTEAHNGFANRCLWTLKPMQTCWWPKRRVPSALLALLALLAHFIWQNRSGTVPQNCHPACSACPGLPWSVPWDRSVAQWRACPERSRTGTCGFVSGSPTPSKPRVRTPQAGRSRHEYMSYRGRPCHK